MHSHFQRSLLAGFLPLFSIVVGSGHASEAGDVPEGERSLGAWRREAGLIAFLDSWKRVEFGTTYDALAIGMLDVDGEGSGAAAGDLTSTLRFTLTKELSISNKLRYRHSFTDPSPSNLGDSVGLLWKVTDGFSDAGFQMPSLYLEDLSFDDALRVRCGQFDPSGLLDQHFYGDAKQFFINQAFSSSPAVGFPSFGAGVVARWDSPGGLDVTVAASTLQGTRSNDGVNWQIGSTALFEGLQLGYDFDGLDERKGRIQVLGWHADAFEEEDQEEGHGTSVTFEHGLSSGAGFFVRYGWADGGATAVDHLVAAGVSLPVGETDDLGFALGAGRSEVDSADRQGVFEVFYRWQALKNLEIAPDFQIITGDEIEGGTLFLFSVRGGFQF